MSIVKEQSNGGFRPNRFTLLSILLASMLMLMGGAAVAPALPLIEEAFPGQDFLVSLIITLPSLAVGIFGFVLGSLADRYGKVRTLLVSLLVFTLAGVASFFLDDLYVILVMRFIVGIGIAGISSAVTALISEYYNGTSRVKVLSYQSAAMGLGVLILETVGGTLANISWHEPFLVYLIGIPILVCCILSMREPNPRDPTIDEQAQRSRAERDVVPRKANTKLIVVCYLAIFICQTMSFLLPTKMPTFLEVDLEVNSSIVGLFLGVNGVANAVMALCYSRISARIRPYLTIALGFLIMGVGMSVLMLSPTIVTSILTMALAGIGIGMICPAVSNTLAAETTASTSGKIMGGYSTFLNFGQFAISLISVPLLALVGGSIPALLAVMGVFAIVIAAVFILYCAHDRRFRSLPSGQ